MSLERDSGVSIFRFSVKQRDGAGARFRSYRCPDCGGVFRHLHETSESPPPSRCALCAAWMEDAPEPVFTPQAPGIRKSPLVKSVDQTYRAMEEASIQRAEEAAGMAWDQAHAAGMTDAQIRDTRVADMSEIKITNMKDPSQMREGDTAVIAPSRPSPVVQSLQALSAQGQGGGFTPLNVNGQVMPGQLLASAAHGDIYPHAGAKVLQRTLTDHAERAFHMQKAGEMGSYSGRG